MSNILLLLYWLHLVCVIVFSVSIGVQESDKINYKAWVGIPRPSPVFNTNGTTLDYVHVEALGQLPSSYFYTHVEFNSSWLCFAFLFFALLDHVVQFGLMTCRSDVFKKGPNLIRWIEYSLSATVMHVLIAVSVGTDDVVKLAVISVLTIYMMYCGFSIEFFQQVMSQDRMAYSAPQRSVQRQRLDDPGHVYSLVGGLMSGWACFTVIWVMILIQYSLSVTSETPKFVHAIVVVLFVLDSAFGAVSLTSLIYPGHDCYSREMAYVLLSLTSKMSLAWLVWGGFKARS
jgi:hypothetical protein